MMHVVRQVSAGDLDAIEDLAMSYTMGVTSLPKNRALLEEKLRLSLASFVKHVAEPSHELYLFLLADTKTHEIGGICGIMARSGTYEATHFYRREVLRSDKGVELPEVAILRPISFQFGPSEICSLFLKQEFRKGGLGKLLSLSRFLFIASHPHRFTDSIIAELRGVITEKMTSPFWDSVGSRFVNMPFKGAMALRDKGLFYFPDLIPQYPIYCSMLSKKAQQVIGKVHDNTKPALKMLKEQGFALTDYLDPFDAGPTIGAKTLSVEAVQKSKTAVILEVQPTLSRGRHYIVSTAATDFVACFSELQVRGGKVIIPLEVAEALQVDVGDTIRYYPIVRS